MTTVDQSLRQAVNTLGAPWNWWARLRFRALRRDVHEAMGGNLTVESAIESVLGPYQNRLTLVAYALLLGAVSVNAWIVTKLSTHPPLAAFAATLGGTLAGALGFQVLARLQAWAKQLSSNGGSLRTEQIPFNSCALDIWRRSQQLKSDLPRDGRNIRKDAWLQLGPRFDRALALSDSRDAHEAVADAIIDHRQTYGEVFVDFWLAREFHRNLKVRFANEDSYRTIREIFRETAPVHGLPLDELDRMLMTILRPETWRQSIRPAS